MKKIVILFFCFVIIIGCSSLPKEVETRSLSFANIRMKLAWDAQKRQDYKKALQLYMDAYDFFTRVDDMKGKIDASLSIARQYYYLDKPGESEIWLNKAGELIETNLPLMITAKLILSIEMAFGKEDYKKVIEIARNASTQDMENQTEILCYDMVSKAQLKMDYKPGFNRMQSILPVLQKKFGKRQVEDPEILSLAYYYTGFIYGNIEKNWRKALDYFEKAKRIDGVIDNTPGVGKDLYSIGRCLEELGLKKEAVGNFDRAAEVFHLLNDIEMMEKAKKRAESIRLEK